MCAQNRVSESVVTDRENTNPKALGCIQNGFFDDFAAIVAGREECLHFAIFGASNQNYMIKAIVVGFIALFAFAHSGFGQSTHATQIYLWDVTYSMKQNDIWEQVRGQLIESIEDVQDLDTEVIVIPFQDDAFEERRVRLSDEKGMQELIDWIHSYELPTPAGGHGTNICRALERAEDFIRPENIDVVFLMTDGTHEPKRPAEMVANYPNTCVRSYLEEHWCPFATVNNAYLVYYQLLGEGEPNVKKYTENACRVRYIKPDSGEPDRLFYVTPQIQQIVADRRFIENGRIEIPLTTSLPDEVFGLCELGASLLLKGEVLRFETALDGSNLTLSLDEAQRAGLAQKCPETSAELPYELMVQLSLKPVDGFMVVLTNDLLPFSFHHYEQRWFEIKSNNPIIEK